MIERPTSPLAGVSAFAAETPTLPPATHTNSYALGERDLLLVEPATPYESERREWLTWARSLTSTGRKIVGIFLTHHHADHVGGGEFFGRELGVPLWAHEDTAARITPEVARKLCDGDEITLDGPTPQRWRVLHTPGHAPGHACLHEVALGALVVGDMVASVGTILIDPVEGDMREYLAQLGRLEKLQARVALPAHGSPIEEPSRLVRAYYAHRLMREGRILEPLRDAPGTLDELVGRAYSDTHPSLWPIAKLSLEAHLIKLERDGHALRHADGWATSES